MLRIQLTFFSLLLAACSGGGGDAPAPAPGSLNLVVDTAAGTDRELRGRVEGALLEHRGGDLTANLLAQSAVLSLTHPLAIPSGLKLAAPPAGDYVALHLVFLPDGLEVLDSDGVVHPVHGPSALRVAFPRGTTFAGGGQTWLALTHEGPVDLTVDARLRLAWNPRMTVDTDTHFLHQARAVVASIDRDGLAADVTLSSADLVARARFAQAEQLGRHSEDRNLTAQEFVDGLRPGSRLLISGVLNNDRSIMVTAAFDLGADDSDDGDRNGRKSEVEGSIVTLSASDRTFELRLRDIRKGGRDLPDTRPLTVTVDVRDAKIKWVPRLARHRGHLDFKDLEVGMFVEVEWLGPLQAGAIPAKKIDIRGIDSPPPPPLRELEARVLEVRVATRELVLAPATTDVFEVGDERLTTLTLEVPQGTLVIDSRSDTPRTRDFDAFEVGQRIWSRGSYQGGDRITAQLVLILAAR